MRSQNFLLDTLAYKNANPECKRILGPLKGQGASVAEFIEHALELEELNIKLLFFAAALAKVVKPQRDCLLRKQDIFKKIVRDKKNEPKNGRLPEKRQPSGLCRRCGKGKHWTQECKI